MNEQQIPAVSSEETKKRGSVSRKLRLGTVATVTTVVVIVAILLLNVVMDIVETRYPLTLDLTAEGTYSLSADSVTLAKGIDKNIEIMVFADETLFTNDDYTKYKEMYEIMKSLGTSFVTACETTLDQFYNMLKQYHLLSDGRVTYQFINLDANPTLASRYEEYEVETGTVLFLSEERYQKADLLDLISVDMNYSTYAYTFSSEVERIVAAKINLVSAANVKTVTLLTGHDEDSGAVASLTSLLSNNACVVETLDITASAEPVEGNDVFIIPAATTDYTAEEIAKLRKWIDNDGKREVDLAVFVNAAVRLPNLYEMLADQYGIAVQEQIVVETEANNVYNQNPYYTYADVQSTDYTASLAGQRVLMAYAAPLKLTITDSTDAAKYTKALASYGETAKVQPLEARLGEDGAASGVESLQVADSYPLVTAAYTSDRLFDNDDDRYYITDVMVFGSPALVYETVANVTSACNEDLFLSTFRGLTGLESVISISSRSLDAKTLDFGGSQTPLVLGIVFMAVLPAAIIAVAITVFVRRRRL